MTERTRVSDELWSADSLLPQEPTPHEHPLSPEFRKYLVVYGVGLALTFLMVFGLIGVIYFDGKADQRAADSLRLQTAQDVRSELDRRTAEREAEDKLLQEQISETQARTRSAVCALVTGGDLGKSPRVDRLAAELAC